jgi:hypothetical protein
MLTQGKLHSEVANALGVSIMTYHRWRKARAAQPRIPSGPALGTRQEASDRDVDARMSALQIENLRLRRLVTDLLLEKVQLEEILESKQSRNKAG